MENSAVESSTTENSAAENSTAETRESSQVPAVAGESTLAAIAEDSLLADGEAAAWAREEAPPPALAGEGAALAA